MATGPFLAMRAVNMLCLFMGWLVLHAAAAPPPLTPATTVSEYLGELNITLENHYVTTKDGYILHLHRMLNPGKPVVFLQHGILASSWCWLINEPELAPAVVLFRAGYDVWLGNSRGNRYSTNHTTLDPKSKAFWNFTFDEMALYDVPAVVKYVSAHPTTKKGKFPYVGWSQATTAFMAATMDTDIGEYLSHHVRLFIALSPVSYLTHSGSVLINVLGKFKLSKLLLDLFPYGILDGSEAEDKFEEFLCKVSLGELCKIGVDSVCGDVPTDSRVQIERLTTHFPTGTSVKDFNQYEQFLEASPPFFGYYSYGEKGNLEHYGTKTAPIYNVTNYNRKIPIAFFRGDSDLLVEAKDFERLRDVFPSSAVVFERVYADMSHVSWYVGEEKVAKTYLTDLLNLVEKY